MFASLLLVRVKVMNSPKEIKARIAPDTSLEINSKQDLVVVVFHEASNFSAYVSTINKDGLTEKTQYDKGKIPNDLLLFGKSQIQLNPDEISNIAFTLIPIGHTCRRIYISNKPSYNFSATEEHYKSETCFALAPFGNKNYTIKANTKEDIVRIYEVNTNSGTNYDFLNMVWEKSSKEPVVFKLTSSSYNKNKYLNISVNVTEGGLNIKPFEELIDIKFPEKPGHDESTHSPKEPDTQQEIGSLSDYMPTLISGLCIALIISAGFVLCRGRRTNAATDVNELINENNQEPLPDVIVSYPDREEEL